VTIPSLCDTLVMYAKTQTYFTATDYGKVKGDEVCIRKCDVNMDTTSRVNADTLDVSD
jgi:hypothetical protein